MATITTQYKGNMLFEAQLGEHTVVIDLPETSGGSDQGPTPPQLFVASLGGCIGVYVAKYCEQNGIDTEGMTVDISYDRATNPSRMVDFKATVRLPNGDCGKRIRAIERVAQHCTVHETINAMDGIGIEILGMDECDLAG